MKHSDDTLTPAVALATLCVYAIGVLFIVGAVVALAGCATDERGHPHRTAPWTPTQQWTFGAMATCQGVDAYQTDWGMNHGFAEGNPMYGSHPSAEHIATIKSAMVGYAWLLEDEWDDPTERTAISSAILLVCGAVVAHNYATERR